MHIWSGHLHLKVNKTGDGDRLQKWQVSRPVSILGQGDNVVEEK